MASQRIIVASLAGKLANAVTGQFDKWRADDARLDLIAVDRFCTAMRANCTSLPIVYFCEWVDRWLMGDLVPGPRAIEGRRFHAACLSRTEAAAWAGRMGSQFPEQLWLAARLREAAQSLLPYDAQGAIVVIREVFDVSATDNQIRAALDSLPDWMSI